MSAEFMTEKKFLLQVQKGRTNFDGVTFESEIDLDVADLSGFSFVGADLSHANLKDANLSNADLTDANLHWTELNGAILTGAKLPHQDEIPVIEDIHLKLYEAITSDCNELEMGEWHSCNTSHCRAGWVIHLAGDAGYKLEAKLETGTAAALIYQKSDPTLERIPEWYTTNDIAMEDIKRLAYKSPNFQAYLNRKYPNCPDCPTPDESFCLECKVLNPEPQPVIRGGLSSERPFSRR